MKNTKEDLTIKRGDTVYHPRTGQIGIVTTISYNMQVDMEMVTTFSEDWIPEKDLIGFNEINFIIDNSINKLHALDKLRERGIDTRTAFFWYEEREKSNKEIFLTIQEMNQALKTLTM